MFRKIQILKSAYNDDKLDKWPITGYIINDSTSHQQMIDGKYLYCVIDRWSSHWSLVQLFIVGGVYVPCIFACQVELS